MLKKIFLNKYKIKKRDNKIKDKCNFNKYFTFKIFNDNDNSINNITVNITRIAIINIQL